MIKRPESRIKQVECFQCYPKTHFFLNPSLIWSPKTYERIEFTGGPHKTAEANEKFKKKIKKKI